MLQTFLMVSLDSNVYFCVYVYRCVCARTHVCAWVKLNAFNQPSTERHLSCFCSSPFSSVLQLNNFFRSIIQFSLLGSNLLISMFIFLFLKVLLCSFSNLRGLFVFVLKINTLIFRTVLGLQKTEQTVQRGPIYLLFPSSVSSVFNILL